MTFSKVINKSFNVIVALFFGRVNSLNNSDVNRAACDGRRGNQRVVGDGGEDFLIFAGTGLGKLPVSVVVPADEADSEENAGEVVTDTNRNHPSVQSFCLEHPAHRRAVVAAIGIYGLTFPFAHLALLYQFFERGAVVDVSRGDVDGADELVVLVGVEVRLVAVKTPVVFVRLAGAGVFVCGLFVAPVLRYQAVFDRFFLVFVEVGLGHGDKGSVYDLPAARLEPGRRQLFSDDLEECLGTTFLGEQFHEGPDSARIG